MNKIVFISLLAFFVLNAFGQERKFEKPDYDQIEKETKDETSEFYYPNLMARFVECDTTLTKDEFRYLYYGYVFQDTYQPYAVSVYDDQLSKYFKSSSINPEEYDTVLDLCTKSMEENPFNLRALNFLSYTYHLKGDEEMAKKTSRKFVNVIITIMYSGNGRTCETAFHVIAVPHEYELMKMIQLRAKGQALEGNCDRLDLEENNLELKQLFFDISKPFSSIRKSLENR